MNTLSALALSSAVAGTLDIASAAFLARKQGMTFTALLQFVASGALGKAAFQGGQATAAAGLFFHYLIAVLWAAAYFLLSSKLPNLLAHPLIFGALYGIVVHLVMSLIVLPLSRAPKRPFAWQPWLVQLAIHITLIGIPIATLQHWYLQR